MVSLPIKKIPVQSVLETSPPQMVCPVCNGQDLQLYRDDMDTNLISSALGSSRNDVSHGRILRCHTCRFGFRQFRPSEESLVVLYCELDSKVYEKESSGRTKTAKRHLRIVQRYVTQGRLLDVGCASGGFLCVAADAGWQVVGVEPAKVLCNQAKQALKGRGDVWCCSLQEASFPPSSFDAITLWDVLEHVPEPVQFMRQCSSLLKPGGYLFVNVPDLDSIPARVLGKRWPLLLAEHLNYFNRASLKRCGELAKLRWVKFGQRPASFSVEYLFYRLAQHNVVGAAFGHRIFAENFLGQISAPIFLGESYGVWKR